MTLRGRIRTAAAGRARAALRAVAQRNELGRRVVRRARDELDAALHAEGTYGASYFGQGRDPFHRLGLSGYERYDRATSNADVAAYLLWRFFSPRRSLDAGCAVGHVVEALRELGVDAGGVDVSWWAVEHAAAGARGHLRRADLTKPLPFDPGSFDVVSALEVLEHVPPDDVAAVLASLRRVTGRYLVATIPSFGPNESGPGGWLTAKVRDEVLWDYVGLGPNYDGPVPYADLARDANGDPVEGHLTIASYRWWTARFAEAGFVRLGDVERRMHVHLARFGLTRFWNLYVLAVPGAPVPTERRDEAELLGVERRWGLADRVPLDEDLAAIAAALGDRAVVEARRPAPALS